MDMVVTRIIGIVFILGIITLITWFVSKRKQDNAAWEYVPDPPEWVQKQIALIEKRYRGGSSWAIDKVWYLKGKSFRYKISFEGQGGNLLYVFRKPRRTLNEQKNR